MPIRVVVVVVDDDGPAKAVAVLVRVMRVVPVRPTLISDTKIVQEIILRLNRALGDARDSIGPVCSML